MIYCGLNMMLGLLNNLPVALTCVSTSTHHFNCLENIHALILHTEESM